VKQRFVEFLFKRVNEKLFYVREASDYEELTAHLNDIEEYVSVLKEIVTEVIKP
jgi:hypothetical protein